MVPIGVICLKVILRLRQTRISFFSSHQVAPQWRRLIIHISISLVTIISISKLVFSSTTVLKRRPALPQNVHSTIQKYLMKFDVI